MSNKTLMKKTSNTNGALNSWKTTSKNKESFGKRFSIK